jgi:hypothetical protein
MKTDDPFIAQMSWDKFKTDLSKPEAFAFAALPDQKTGTDRTQDEGVEVENSERTTNEIPSQYAEFHDIFSKVDAHKLPKHDSQNHVIEILSSRESFFGPIYNLSAAELKILKAYIDEYMKNEFITKFVSSASVLILFVKKSDDKLRSCVNYRELNEIIIKNRYSFSLVNENLNRLFGAKIFSKLDVRNVFHRIRIRESDE